MRDPIFNMKGLLARNFSTRVLASSESIVWVLDLDIGVDPAGIAEGPLSFGKT